MPNKFKCYSQTSPGYGLFIVYTLYFFRLSAVVIPICGKSLSHTSFFLKSRMIQAIYYLQNLQYSEKPVKYTLNIHKSISNNIKSPKKDEKAVSIYLTSLLYQAFLELFSLHSPINPYSYDIS